MSPGLKVRRQMTNPVTVNKQHLAGNHVVQPLRRAICVTQLIALSVTKNRIKSHSNTDVKSRDLCSVFLSVSVQHLISDF